MKRIQIEKITYSYGRKQVLKDVSISADAGQSIGIVGVNGCGKSTLLSILAGVRKPDGGSIFYNGTSMTESKNKKLFSKYTGYVPQNNALISELTVWDNLLLWHLDKEVLIQKLQEGFLKELNLWEMRKLKITELSGGMKKRVSIGCAMAGEPEILILDEPSAALDLPGKADMERYLNLFKQGGGTVVFSTHEESELAICDKLYIIDNGICKEIDSGIQKEHLITVLRGGKNG